MAPRPTWHTLHATVQRCPSGRSVARVSRAEDAFPTYALNCALTAWQTPAACFFTHGLPHLPAHALPHSSHLDSISLPSKPHAIAFLGGKAACRRRRHGRNVRQKKAYYPHAPLPEHCGHHHLTHATLPTTMPHHPVHLLDTHTVYRSTWLLYLGVLVDAEDMWYGVFATLSCLGSMCNRAFGRTTSWLGVLNRRWVEL